MALVQRRRHWAWVPHSRPLRGPRLRARPSVSLVCHPSRSPVIPRVRRSGRRASPARSAIPTISRPQSWLRVRRYAGLDSISKATSLSTTRPWWSWSADPKSWFRTAVRHTPPICDAATALCCQGGCLQAVSASTRRVPRLSRCQYQDVNITLDEATGGFRAELVNPQLLGVAGARAVNGSFTQAEGLFIALASLHSFDEYKT
jgi:hypothetical protein